MRLRVSPGTPSPYPLPRRGRGVTLRPMLLLGVAAILLASQEAWACSVCAGDVESPLTKGAMAGVLVLVGVVGFVLAGMAGTGLFWIQRSRRAGHDSSSSRTP